MRVLNNYVIVKPVDKPSLTKGGLHLPKGSLCSCRGQVIGVGLECKPEIKIGVIVVYNAYSVTSMEINDEKVVIVDEKNIYCVE